MELNCNPDWTRTSTSAGYPVVFCPDHPKAWSTGYVHVHRLVMELHLGRMLLPGEVVHHKDGDKKNFNIRNLELHTNSSHSTLHGTGKRKTVVTLTCPQCGAKFVRERRQT